jgi:hypothetical protein
MRLTSRSVVQSYESEPKLVLSFTKIGFVGGRSAVCSDACASEDGSMSIMFIAV